MFKDPTKMSERELRLEVMDRRREERETTYYDCRERYERDPKFRQLVDMMTAFAINEKFTPGDLRDAAFMGSLRYEALVVRDMVHMVPRGDIG